MLCYSLSAYFMALCRPHFQETEEIPLASQLRRSVANDMTHKVTRNVVSEVHLNLLLCHSLLCTCSYAARKGMWQCSHLECIYWFEMIRRDPISQSQEIERRQHTSPCFTMLLMSLWFWKESPIAVLQCVHLEQKKPVLVDCNAPTHIVFGSTFGSSWSYPFFQGFVQEEDLAVYHRLFTYFWGSRNSDCNQKIHSKTKLFCFCFLFYCYIASILGHGMD